MQIPRTEHSTWVVIISKGRNNCELIAVVYRAGHSWFEGFNTDLTLYRCVAKLVFNKEVQILCSIISAVYLHRIMESVNEHRI